MDVANIPDRALDWRIECTVTVTRIVYLSGSKANMRAPSESSSQYIRTFGLFPRTSQQFSYALSGRDYCYPGR
jgi:hypothetical protein